MPVNFWDNFNRDNERKLYNDCQDEVCEMFGLKMKYFPKRLRNSDLILGEAPDSFFDEVYCIHFYLENYEAFGGQGNLFQKFGFDATDQLVLVIQQDRFINEVGEPPEIDDLVFFEHENKLFEVYHVEPDNPFYLLGKSMGYKLLCRSYEYSAEMMDTGIDEVDDLYDDANIEVPNVNDENQEILDDVSTIIDNSEESPFGSIE
jgi:hypothetical protein